MSLRNCTWAFLLLLATGAQAQEAAAPASRGYTIFLRGTPIGREDVTVRSDGSGLSIVSQAGDLAESSLNFLAGCAAKEWPVLMMPYELFAGLGPARAHCAVWARRVIEALGQQPRVAIGIGQPTLPGRREGARLGRWLTETVRQVLAAARPDRVCVEGGSTSAQLLRRLARSSRALSRSTRTRSRRSSRSSSATATFTRSPVWSRSS